MVDLTCIFLVQFIKLTCSEHPDLIFHEKIVNHPAGKEV